eukprot:631534-Pelagomonas_calceolata.AAC.1
MDKMDVLTFHGQRKKRKTMWAGEALPTPIKEKETHWLKKRKVHAGQRPRALRKGPLTSELARASPEVP